MFELVDPGQKERLEMEDLQRISEELKYGLSEEELREVVNNVAGFGKGEVTWEQFNKYIAKKVDKR